MTESEERAAFEAWRNHHVNIISGKSPTPWAAWQAARASSPLEARLRDVKTNQEIDAMVREMKQPSDDAAIAELIPICSRVLAAFQNLGVVEHLRERYAARHECESAILALEKAIDAVRHAEPMRGEGA